MAYFYWFSVAHLVPGQNAPFWRHLLTTEKVDTESRAREIEAELRRAFGDEEKYHITCSRTRNLFESVDTMDEFTNEGR